MTKGIVGYRLSLNMAAKAAMFSTRNRSQGRQVFVQTARINMLAEKGTAFWQISPNASTKMQRKERGQQTSRMTNMQRNLSQGTQRKHQPTTAPMQPLSNELVRMNLLRFIYLLMFSPVAFLHLSAFQKMVDALFQNHPT